MTAEFVMLMQWLGWCLVILLFKITLRLMYVNQTYFLFTFFAPCVTLYIFTYTNSVLRGGEN